ncbi:MAG: hypothetical protein U0230_19250 [Polyangiales bacterium]
MSVASIVERYSALPPDRVRVWTSGAVGDADRSIVFVLAPWSGQAIAAFQKLTELLARAAESPPLFVCDIDALSAEVRSLFGELRGNGETFWIRDGRIVAALRDFTTDEVTDSVAGNGELLRS